MNSMKEAHLAGILFNISIHVYFIIFSHCYVWIVYTLFCVYVGVKNVHADHTASHLGKAQGLVTLVRGIPLNASQGRVYIPVELMIHVRTRLSNEFLWK